MRCPTLKDLPPPPEGKSGWPWTEETPQLPDTMQDGSAWPRISIVIPTYNQGQFIEETIRSVLLQGYPDLEFIIINDGSTDNTVEIIKRYEWYLAYWVTQDNQGQSSAINEGLKRCTGDIITFQHSDDIYLKGTFADVGSKWLRLKHYGVVVGGFYYIDYDRMRNLPIQARLPHEGPIDLVTASPKWWRLHQVSTFYTRFALDKVGRYVREDLYWHMDRELLYRVCRNYKVMLAEKPYAAYRWHSKSKSGSDPFGSELEYAALQLSYSYKNKEDNRKKIKNANYHKAKAYIHYAKDSNNLLTSSVALIRCLFYRPSLIINISYIRNWLEVLDIISVLKRLERKGNE